MKLALIVGHTKRAPGAKAVEPISTYEYFFNGGVAVEACKRAEAQKMSCRIFFKDGLTDEQVAAAVHRWTSDEKRSVCIELHFNAANGKARGTETLYDADPTTSKTFAEVVQKHVTKALSRTGSGDRGLKLIGPGDRGHRNLRTVKIASCLIEPAFGDTPLDAKLLFENQERYAQSLVDAAKEFLR